MKKKNLIIQKNATKYVCLLLLSVLLTACGKKEEKVATASQDGNTVVIDSKIDVNSIPELAVPSENDTVDATNESDDWFKIYDSAGSPDKNINFEGFQSKCSDVYAYIDIPGTNISYPIAFCEDQLDPYWFTHDIDGNESESAMIITDSANSDDFSDPLTLIYGHNPDDKTMFHDLHNFRDAEFFNNHDTINIYMKGGQLIYKIYTAYIGSNENMLYYTDFNNPVSFAEYFENAEATRDLSINVRESERPEFTDHVIVLVTHCDDPDKRMLVQAVLSDVKY